MCLSIRAKGLLDKRTVDYGIQEVRQCWGVFILKGILLTTCKSTGHWWIALTASMWQMEEWVRLFHLLPWGNTRDGGKHQLENYLCLSTWKESPPSLLSLPHVDGSSVGLFINRLKRVDPSCYNWPKMYPSMLNRSFFIKEWHHLFSEVTCKIRWQLNIKVKSWISSGIEEYFIQNGFIDCSLGMSSQEMMNLFLCATVCTKRKYTFSEYAKYKGARVIAITPKGTNLMYAKWTDATKRIISLA